MFLVTDPITKRQAKIVNFLTSGEQFVAVLLAAADFERTVRRAIIALGVTPTAELARQLGRKGANGSDAKAKPPKYRASLKGYEKAWTTEVLTLRGLGKRFFGDVIASKQELEVAFNLRHELIHGDRGTASSKFAAEQVQVLLEATKAIDNYASENGADLTKRIKVRRKPRR
jgi:hypothetical protein